MNYSPAAILSDFSAFCDDENEVDLDPRGEVLFRRFGQDISCTLTERPDGMLLVNDGSGPLPYNLYIARRLAQLDSFAQKLLSDRKPDPFFIDGPAESESVHKVNANGTVLQLLDEQCNDVSLFSSRVVFITADAGYGKTALLRQYQHDVAHRFINGQSPYLFWHVDLQGRQLLRLSEALMGDLGDLRVSGLFMPSILTLIRHRLLVLAIDGFDELAAEQGSSDALGALRVLLDQMACKGVIVAASRRTFFNSESYARRTNLVMPSARSRLNEFNEIRLKPWRGEHVVRYLDIVRESGRHFDAPAHTYATIVAQLGNNESHPMVTTPFLISHVAKGILRYGTSAEEFIRGMTNPVQGIPAVVDAFVAREVRDKWKNKDTGEPYLTVDQHLELLTAIAEEMWTSQVERLSIDVIESITALLLEQWGISADRRRNVHEMVRMHVLLSRPVDARDDVRAFEHVEFRNYFVARGFCGYLQAVVSGRHRADAGRFLAVGQLSDSVARFAASMTNKAVLDVPMVVSELCAMVGREWRPSFLQANVGTIVPWLLDRSEQPITVEGKLVFSSVVFKGTRLKDVEIRSCHLSNTPFEDVVWRNVRFVDCVFSEVSFDLESVFDGVRCERCTFEGVSLTKGGTEVERGYSMRRILQMVGQVGLVVMQDGERPAADVNAAPTELNKLVSRLLRAFRRSSGLTAGRIRLKFPADLAHRVLHEVIPLMQSKGLVESVEWRGKGTQEIWTLTRSVDDILRADGGEGDEKLEGFWEVVNSPED